MADARHGAFYPSAPPATRPRCATELSAAARHPADMDLGTTLSLLSCCSSGLLLGGGARRAARPRARRPGAAPERHVLAQAESRAAEAAVVRESLDRLHDQMRDMAQHGVSWQSQLKQQVEDVRHSTDALRRETAALSTALRKPQVRGRWGELHLRRVVELAGLVDRCDFAEQVTARSGDDGAAAPRPGGQPRRRQARRRRRQGAARRVPRRHRRPATPTPSATPHLRPARPAAAPARRRAGRQGLLARAAGHPGVRGALRARASRSCPRRSRPSRRCWSTPPTGRSCWPRRPR